MGLWAVVTPTPAVKALLDFCPGLWELTSPPSLLHIAHSPASTSELLKVHPKGGNTFYVRAINRGPLLANLKLNKLTRNLF